MKKEKAERILAPVPGGASSKSPFVLQENERKEVAILLDEMDKAKLEYANLELTIENFKIQKSVARNKIVEVEKSLRDKIGLLVKAQGHDLKEDGTDWKLDFETMTCSPVFMKKG